MRSTEHGPSDDENNLLHTLQGVLDIERDPSAILGDSEEIACCNGIWPHDRDEDVTVHHTLANSLINFEGADRLKKAVRIGRESEASDPFGRCDLVSRSEPFRRYEANWRHFRVSTNQICYTLIVLRPIRSPESFNTSRVTQRLIVRQSLIEEAERLRLGRALHDTVVQDLAWIRSQLLSKGGHAFHPEDCVAAMDRVIERVRTLSFELSPPILSDLGIIAALHWLGEHIGGRYDRSISVVDDGNEPQLSLASRTIVFRCARELTINAAKYATAGEIIVSCRTTKSEALVQVRDFGPGFEFRRIQSPVDEQSGFGLISVEEQIRGIGASFELSSEPGVGTRATIRIPLQTSEGTNVA